MSFNLDKRKVMFLGPESLTILIIFLGSLGGAYMRNLILHGVFVCRDLKPLKHCKSVCKKANTVFITRNL